MDEPLKGKSEIDVFVHEYVDSSSLQKETQFEKNLSYFLPWHWGRTLPKTGFLDMCMQNCTYAKNPPPISRDVVYAAVLGQSKLCKK